MFNNNPSSFAKAVSNQVTRTDNGMKVRKSSNSSALDLFFSIGASRSKNIIPSFAAAFAEDKDLALRIAAWARDVREGCGEREVFRSILRHLETADPASAILLMRKIPELGRWDDLLVVQSDALKAIAFDTIKDALQKGNALCAKWMPRQGPLAAQLRKHLGFTPKQYRKCLVALTQVVESKMCLQKWDDISFSQVPSLAAARYKKAFNRHTEAYKAYVTALIDAKNTSVKVNAGALFPHDVLKGFVSTDNTNGYDATELSFIKAQWEALPNLIGSAQLLPMVDVSGSMNVYTGPITSSTTCLDVAVSLGLYCADKNQGAFKDLFLTFSEKPALITLKGNILDKVFQLQQADWEMNTNLHSAFELILSVAKSNQVPESEMPQILLILSDMQFDECTTYDDSAFEMIQRKYSEAGYRMPQIVFWNLKSQNGVPVAFTESGAALVSGFSPNLLKQVLQADLKDFTAEAIMLATISKDRYHMQ